METENKIQKEAPKVTQAEVVKWENDFRENVSPLVKFDSQDNGYSMKFYNGESGVDAYWSGTIILKSDNYLKWNFSMLNGVFVESKMNIDENNQKIPSNLYEFFKSWQGEVAKTITEPNPESQSQEAATVSQPEQSVQLSGPESTNATQGQEALSEGILLGNNVVLQRVDKSRKDTIMDSFDRMKRLAGLK